MYLFLQKLKQRCSLLLLALIFIHLPMAIVLEYFYLRLFFFLSLLVSLKNRNKLYKQRFKIKISIFLNTLYIISKSEALAGWQSGYAAACKAVYAGSIPASRGLICILVTFLSGMLSSMYVLIRHYQYENEEL